MNGYLRKATVDLEWKELLSLFHWEYYLCVCIYTQIYANIHEDIHVSIF